MREQYERLSPKNAVAKAIRYMLVRWVRSRASSTTGAFA